MSVEEKKKGIYWKVDLLSPFWRLSGSPEPWTALRDTFLGTTTARGSLISFRSRSDVIFPLFFFCLSVLNPQQLVAQVSVSSWLLDTVLSLQERKHNKKK